MTKPSGFARTLGSPWPEMAGGSKGTAMRSISAPAVGSHDERSGYAKHLCGNKPVEVDGMTDALVWERDGRNWPNRQTSRFVRAAGLTWHVQEMGAGPVLLLLHGTGASTHSWRELAPLLAERFHVVALDLPGHGFTQAPPREFLSVFGMGLAVNSLLKQLGAAPATVLGHSAGAAIAARMCIAGHVAPRLIVGVNAALLPLRGIAGHVFSPLAKVLTRIPFVPRLFARRAVDRSMIESMLADTGSVIDREGIDLYWRLAQSPRHIAAAFGMMAEWDLPRLEKELRKLKTPLVLLSATNDKSIAPSDAERVRSMLPQTRIVPIEGLGHLAHEERPGLIADIVFDAAQQFGVLKVRS
jgi:magnesium chelatase accessory protein